MKYLEIPSLEAINIMLSHLDSMDQARIYGRIEAYTCKSAGSDKKLYKKLEHKFNPSTDSSSSPRKSHGPEEDGEEEEAPSAPHSSPTAKWTSGHPFSKVHYYLIATLNAAFPDYDFSEFGLDHFVRQPSLVEVMNQVNTTLYNLGINKNYHSFTDFNRKFWDSINLEIDLNECEIFTYLPDGDSDPFDSEDCLWSFNYFFWNKRLKRILFFYCRASTPCSSSQSEVVEDGLSIRSLTPFR